MTIMKSQNRLKEIMLCCTKDVHLNLIGDTHVQRGRLAIGSTLRWS